MTSIKTLNNRGRAAAEAFRELQDIIEATAPLADDLDDKKKLLHEAILEAWDSGVDLSDYLAGGDGFKYEDLLVRIKVAVHMVPDDSDDVELNKLLSRQAKLTEEQKIVKAKIKARQDILLAQGKLSTHMSKIVPSYTKIAL